MSKLNTELIHALQKKNRSRRFSLSFLIMQEISSSDVSSVCSDSYKIDILPWCAEFRFVLGQKSTEFFGVAADFRMPAGLRHSS